MSPEYCSPPSPITGTPAGAQACAASKIAVTCGTPTPATTRVVQIDPGPTPTFTASTPASTSACAPARVATFPPMICTWAVMRVGLEPPHHLQEQPSVPVRGVGDQHVDPRLDQGARALPRVAVEADRRTHPQPALVVLGRQRILLGLHEVLDRDQPGEASLRIHQRQLLDLVLGEDGGGIAAADPGRSGDQRHRGHDVAHEHAGERLGGQEQQVAVGDDAQQGQVGLHHRQTGDPVASAQLVQLGDGGVRRDGERVVDHARLAALDHVDLLRLVGDRQVAMQHSDAALAGHRDGHPRLGDRVHRSGDQRNGQTDAPGQTRAGVHLGGDDVGLVGQQQHIVVRQAGVAELGLGRGAVGCIHHCGSLRNGWHQGNCRSGTADSLAHCSESERSADLVDRTLQAVGPMRDARAGPPLPDHR